LSDVISEYVSFIRSCYCLKSFVRFKVSGLISYMFIEERQVNGTKERCHRFARVGAFLGWLDYEVHIVVIFPSCIIEN
jgi:hypothetical protein